MKMAQNCDAEHFTELTIHLALSGLYSLKMIDCKGSYERLRGKQSVMDLVDQGCDQDILLNCLAFARALPVSYPALDIAALRRVAKNLSAVRKELKQIMPSVTLPFLSGDDDAMTSVPVSGDFHLSREFRSELLRKERVCIHVADLCSQGKIPHRDDIRLLAYLWPALYCKQVTGKYRYALVAQLLKDAGFGYKNEAQLSRAMTKARAKYSGVMVWMMRALYWWNRAAFVLGSDWDESDEDESTGHVAKGVDPERG
jgi:hypothetical protein